MSQMPYLPTYAKALWGRDMSMTEVNADLPRAVLALQAQATLNLPINDSIWPDDALACARVAHAAAHQAFAHPPQARGSLKPVQLALYGVLEDARVELLALQELPGLRALWLPFHSGEDALHGNGFEALLARLSRVLLDPSHQDPHAWIQKVKRIFFTTTDPPHLALTSQALVREAVSLLGNDIGQMRLPFNPAGYCVHAAYRDDNSHLWLPQEELVASTPLDKFEPQAQASSGEGSGTSNATPTNLEAQPAALGVPVLYPEWDYRARHYRPDWCQVYAVVEPVRMVKVPLIQPPVTQLWQQWLAHRQMQLRRSAQRETEGDVFLTDALINAHLARRSGRDIDPRIYQRLERQPTSSSVLLLIDLSASTGEELLQRHAQAASYCAERLAQQGHACAIWGFRSWGRLHIDVLSLKDWHEPVTSTTVQSRLLQLRSGGSTRLGAVLRHAIHTLARRATTADMVLLSDGEAHDIDVHDSRYLARDYAQACREARLKGIGIIPYQFDSQQHNFIFPVFDSN
jgi:nitric oxide reductase NorD protein